MKDKQPLNLKPKDGCPKLHSGHMEVAVAELIGWREHTIVPNVFWGLNLRHEADLLVLDKAGRFTEIEIKVTLSDLKADFKKKHDHYSRIIGRLIYAVPDKLVEYAKEHIPKQSGLISVKWNQHLGKFEARWVYTCKHQKGTEKPDQKTIQKFMELGCMRIWSLKSTLNSRALAALNSKGSDEMCGSDCCPNDGACEHCQNPIRKSAVRLGQSGRVGCVHNTLKYIGPWYSCETCGTHFEARAEAPSEGACDF